ncbi:hypothetical protein OH77DRAFT_1524056 [Trametes cingulata]|nr:hypothetical protein OH77DRAFT_1524056 [Trametes cingulata]
MHKPGIIVTLPSTGQEGCAKPQVRHEGSRKSFKSDIDRFVEGYLPRLTPLEDQDIPNIWRNIAIPMPRDAKAPRLFFAVDLPFSSEHLFARAREIMALKSPLVQKKISYMRCLDVIEGYLDELLVEKCNLRLWQVVRIGAGPVKPATAAYDNVFYVLCHNQTRDHERYLRAIDNMETYIQCIKNAWDVPHLEGPRWYFDKDYLFERASHYPGGAEALISSWESALAEAKTTKT